MLQLQAPDDVCSTARRLHFLKEYFFQERSQAKRTLRFARVGFAKNEE
jgi:hypothetical protein